MRKHVIFIIILLSFLAFACKEKLRFSGGSGSTSELTVLFVNDEAGEATPCG